MKIIGEHIDYMGYGVLPFALEVDCLIAVAVDNSDHITISHVSNPNVDRLMLVTLPIR